MLFKSFYISYFCYDNEFLYFVRSRDNKYEGFEVTFTTKMKFLCKYFINCLLSNILCCRKKNRLILVYATQKYYGNLCRQLKKKKCVPAKIKIEYKQKVGRV